MGKVFVMTKIALMFPGQGAFYAGALQQSRFHLCVERVLAVSEGVAWRRFGRSLVEAMGAEGSGSEHLLKTDPALLQLAIFTVSVAGRELLRAEGIEADRLIGHSFGEIAALTNAGVYSVEQGAEIVCDRVESLAEAAPRDACMAAVSAGPVEVRRILEGWNTRRSSTAIVCPVAVAVENHDRQTVVSGPSGDVSAFIDYCGSQEISAQRLHAPYGFHHPDLEAVATTFAARLTSYPPRPLQGLVYSPILGRYYRDDDDFGSCLARHLVLPVQFGQGIRFLNSDGVDIYIECGALDALSKIVARVLGPARAKTFPLFARQSDELQGLERIVKFLKETKTMTNSAANDVSADFEMFWRERSPLMLGQIKSEFERFLVQQHFQRNSVEAQPSKSVVSTRPVASHSTAIAPAAAQPTAAEPVRLGGNAVPPEKLFKELVSIYAEAMEYPPEVFTEAVELEAELGIDSVKQTEIMGRISHLYGLPPLPANVRMGDYKTMGQIVEFVFAHQYKAAA
jgi:acyl transferase domain-containing protein/acyl carrier protein